MDFIYFIIVIFLKFLGIFAPLLICISYITLVERKVLAGMQRRRGPNVVGLFGFMQPFADGLKLILKETILPAKSNRLLFIFAPILTFFLSLVAWAVLPIDYRMVFADLHCGVLYILGVSSLGVYGIIISGWASNSKYAFLGALRAAAQMISYEISIGFIILTVMLVTGSLNLTEIVLAQSCLWNCFALWPSFLMFLIASLAETNRPPFDLPEAEAELVAGYMVEYSSMSFALFFLGEYGNIILISSLSVIFFLGGWLPPFDFVPFTFLPGSFWFFFKLFFILYFFVWVRASLPRYRYDQLMHLGWKRLLPLSFGFLVFVAGVLVGFDILPVFIV